jgi:hypothetical protein
VCAHARAHTHTQKYKSAETDGMSCFMCNYMLEVLVETDALFGICARLGYYAPYSGNSVPTFRENLSVSSSRVNILISHFVCTFYFEYIHIFFE